MDEFIDRLRQGIGKGITTVSAKSKEMLETTKIKGHIGALQDKKKISLEELGNIVYVMFRKGSLDEERIKSKCELISGLDAQITEKEDELKKIYLETQEALGAPKVVGVCACGADLYAATKFCGKCGKKVDEMAETKGTGSSGPKSCSKCGTTLESGTKFCGKCGAKQ